MFATAQEHADAERLLFDIVSTEPQLPTREVVARLQAQYPDATHYFVYTTYEKYNWTFKNVSHKQTYKHLHDNLECYEAYTPLIKQIPLIHIKYMDEMSIVSREIRKKRGVGPANQPVRVVNGDSLTEHYAVSMMVGFHDASSQHVPVLLDMRAEGMNTSLDFAAFVGAAVTVGFLVSGDVLVCDNAKVHKQPFITLELERISRATQHRHRLSADVQSGTESVRAHIRLREEQPAPHARFIALILQ